MFFVDFDTNLTCMFGIKLHSAQFVSKYIRKFYFNIFTFFFLILKVYYHIANLKKKAGKNTHIFVLEEEKHIVKTEKFIKRYCKHNSLHENMHKKVCFF